MRRQLIPALSALALLVAPAAFAEDAAGDAVKGAKLFKRCAACHAVGDGAKNKVGPHLNGIMGRAAAAGEGYSYSKAMIAKGEEGLVWTEENLGEYLTKPKSFVPGTKMNYAGLRKPEQRADLIAYLKQYSNAE